MPAPIKPCRMGTSVKVAKYMNAPKTDAKKLVHSGQSARMAPLSLNRFLLYLFYRWETCVRQATVLGMLSLVSLGFWIQDARTRNHYDEMVVAMACGALLVVVGDLVSAVAREVVRRS